MLNIPYTGSRVLTNGIALDKTMTKRIWRDRGLPVAPFQEFIYGDERLCLELKFPLFVKPFREGTGIYAKRTRAFIIVLEAQHAVWYNSSALRANGEVA